MKSRICLAMMLVLTMSGLSLAGEKDPELSAEKKADALKTWGQSPLVFLAKLTDVQQGPTGMSYPPLYSYRLTLEPTEFFRGSLTEKTIKCSYQIRGEQPTFEAGKTYILSAKQDLRIKQVILGHYALATPEEIAAARWACKIPLGWRMEKGVLLSPWARKAAMSLPKLGGKIICGGTGREARLAGEGVEMTVAPAPPRKEIKWRNPDGDGEYIITVRNTTDKPLKVPALLKKGDEILWNESIVILSQGKAYPAPLGTGKVPEDVECVTLEPGQSVSGKINALMLEGPDWPRGGYRIEFTFCLGEKGVSQSFYYFSQHHDPLRDAAIKAKNAVNENAASQPDADDDKKKSDA